MAEITLVNIIFAGPQGTSSATMQLISMIEVGPMDKFQMIVVKQNVKVYGSTRTLNVIDSHAWNLKKILDVQLFSKLFRENLHNMACKQPITTYVATPTSSYTNKPVLDSMDASPPGPRFGTLSYQFRFFP